MVGSLIFSTAILNVKGLWFECWTQYHPNQTNSHFIFNRSKFPLVEMCFWHKSQTVCISMGSNDYKISWNVHTGLCFDWTRLSSDWLISSELNWFFYYLLCLPNYLLETHSIYSNFIYLVDSNLSINDLFVLIYPRHKHHTYETYIRKLKTKTYRTLWNYHTN